MVDRLPSDHDDVTSHRVAVERHGGPAGRALLLPDIGLATADRLTLDGAERFAAVTDGRLVGAYDTPDVARERSGTDRLAPWLDRTGREPGSSVVLDEIPGARIGLRAPGERVVYDAAAPDSSLADIARGLDG
jgi:hypothetical protein